MTTKPYLQQILQFLKTFERPLVGLLLIALFAYTALVIQNATNVGAEEVTSSAAVSFDRETLTGLKDLTVVSGDTPLGSLGKSDPFGQ